MDIQERELVDRLIVGQAEIKAELKAINLHLAMTNGSIQKHFAADEIAQRENDDWKRAHDVRMAGEDGEARGRKQALSALDRILVLSGPVVGAIIAIYHLVV